MADATSPPTKARSPVWMRVLLIVSLALNIGIIGVVGGTVFRGKPDAPLATGAGSDFQLFVAAMPDEHRRAMRRAFFQQLSFLREQRTQMLERRAEMIGLLRQAELNEADLRALMEAQQAGWVELGKRGQMLILERVQVMTAEERSRFADNLEKAPERKDRRWDRDHRPRPSRPDDQN